METEGAIFIGRVVYCPGLLVLRINIIIKTINKELFNVDRTNVCLDTLIQFQ